MASSSSFTGAKVEEKTADEKLLEDLKADCQRLWEQLEQLTEKHKQLSQPPPASSIERIRVLMAFKHKYETELRLIESKLPGLDDDDEYAAITEMEVVQDIKRKQIEIRESRQRLQIEAKKIKEQKTRELEYSTALVGYKKSALENLELLKVQDSTAKLEQMQAENKRKNEKTTADNHVLMVKISNFIKTHFPREPTDNQKVTADSLLALIEDLLNCAFEGGSSFIQVQPQRHREEDVELLAKIGVLERHCILKDHIKLVAFHIR